MVVWPLVAQKNLPLMGVGGSDSVLAAVQETRSLRRPGARFAAQFAANLRGVEYPVRDPSAEPPYLSAEDAANPST